MAHWGYRCDALSSLSPAPPCDQNPDASRMEDSTLGEFSGLVADKALELSGLIELSFGGLVTLIKDPAGCSSTSPSCTSVIIMVERFTVIISVFKKFLTNAPRSLGDMPSTSLSLVILDCCCCCCCAARAAARAAARRRASCLSCSILAWFCTLKQAYEIDGPNAKREQ